MTAARRSALLPTFQQLLGSTPPRPDRDRKTGRSRTRRSARAVGALLTFGTLALLAGRACTFV